MEEGNLYHTESEDTVWLESLESHRDTWKKQKNERLLKSEQLEILDMQLNTYLEHPLCSEMKSLLPGRGSETPLVVFVALNPSPFDMKTNTPFTEGNWVDVLMDKIKSSIDDTSEEKIQNICYFMYVFPYYLGKGRNPTSIEETIFLPYALQRIELLQPKIVVSLGSRAGRYVFARFNPQKTGHIQQYAELMERTVTQQMPEKMKIIPSHEMTLFACPHPYQIMEFIQSNKEYALPVRNSAFSEIEVNKFNDCFTALLKILNKHKITGPKFYNPETKREAINPSETMMTESDTVYKQIEFIAASKKRKAPIGSKKERGKNQISMTAILKTVNLKTTDQLFEEFEILVGEKKSNHVQEDQPPKTKLTLRLKKEPRLE